MARKKAPTRIVCVRPRLRVMVGNEIALGPGRVDLLELIGETGSLQAAARRMGISYMRAWNLVKDTNRCFKEPVVKAVRGGKTGGGARLTELGAKVSRLYRRMERETERVVQPSWNEIRKLLGK